jgi:hypothetical protein
VLLRTVNDKLHHPPDIMRRNGLRESELFRKNRGYSDFVRLDVYVGRDDRPGSVVDSLPLKSNPFGISARSFFDDVGRKRNGNAPSCSSGRALPSFRALA